MARRFLLSATFLVFLLAAIPGCSGSGTKSGTNPITPSTGVTVGEPKPGGKAG